MVRFLKFKFLTILKLNLMGVNFIKKYKILVISKNCEICSEIKFEIEYVQHLRQKLWAENLESKILSEFKLNKMSIEWMDVKAGLQQSKYLVTASMGEWMNGWVE